MAEQVTANPRLGSVRLVQAEATDGWFRTALAEISGTTKAQPADSSPMALKRATATVAGISSGDNLHSSVLRA